MLVHTAQGQIRNLSNLRTQIFTLDTFKSISLPSNFIPLSLIVIRQDSAHTPVTQFFSSDNLQLTKDESSLPVDTFRYKLYYRIVKGKYFEPYYLNDTSLILPAWSPDLSSQNLKGIETGLLLAKSKIDYRGAFTRGIAIGNNQNLTLNSGFNLQLAGDLGDDIHIRGALTDNQIPIQPEGNTQQLQEFDKVFITLSNKNSSLTAGDFELARPKGYFINYFKKLQGVQIENKSTIRGRDTLISKGGIAITKGKFNRVSLPISEGNQGPYRLPGAEGEQFVVVLSGSERVYADGVLLTRGYDQDYIIDYNSGEITFMPAFLITKDRRIIIEYEYSNQQYLRSVANASVEYAIPKWKFIVNAYSEQDGKNSNRSRELSKEDKQLLASLGDSINNTLVNSLRTIDPGADLSVVSYSLIDTVVNGQSYKILIFPWRIGTSRLVADFTETSGGNYIRLNNGVNGRVYQWVAPDPVTGKPSGQYEPLTKLIPPNQQQMFSGSAAWKPDSLSGISTEIALSNKDLNRFSSLDNGDNQGLGLHLNAYKNNITISKKINWSLNTRLNYELINKTFTYINPYRSIEFQRDWNLPTILLDNQHLLQAALNQKFGNKYSLNYAFSLLNNGNEFTGNKNEINSILTLKQTEFKTFVSLLQTATTIERTQFLRPGISFSQGIPKWAEMKILVSWNAENNIRENRLADTLLNLSYNFNIYKASIQNNFKQKFKTELFWQLREDKLPVKNDLIDAYISRDLGTKINWTGNENNLLNLNATWHTISLQDAQFQSKVKPKNTYIGQLEYLFHWFKNRMNGNTFFEVSSGQEKKVDWNFVRVQPGQGTYAWEDFNHDSIQQINEFVIAPFPDQAVYTRVTILSNQFISTFNTSFSQSLKWEPKSKVNTDSKINVFFNKFSAQSFYRLERKIFDLPVKGYWNPLYYNIPDSALVSYAQSQQHSLYYNRGDAIWESSLQLSINETKSILSSGYEKRATNNLTFDTRVNITPEVSTFLILAQKIKKSDSQMFITNKYAISGQEIKPQISWMIEDKVRLTSGYRWINQKNTIGTETAVSNNIYLTAEYNKSTVSSFNFTFTFVDNQLRNTTNTAIEFALLEGLKAGKNYLWNLTFNQSLKNNIQLSFGYDGRKSEGFKTIHTGRASMKALF